MYFDIAGDGELIQNQGTVTGSRKVQHARTGTDSGRTQNGTSCVAVKADKVRTSLITVQ